MNSIILHKLKFNTLTVGPPLPNITHLFHRLSHAFKHDLKSLEVEAFKTHVVLALISSKSSNRVPFSTDLSLVNRKKSQEVRSRLYGGCGNVGIYFSTKYSRTARDECAGAFGTSFAHSFRMCSLS